MAKIAWTNETWNPVIGCTKISEGCRNCYAEKMAARLNYMGVDVYSLVLKNGSGWNGKVVCREGDVLSQPFQWKKPRKIFVCSMGDLFHEKVPFDYIAKVIKQMVIADQHVYQVLTKRPERMAEFFNKNNMFYRLGVARLPNLWHGVTCENQKIADERIPIFLRIPAAIRFLNIEPMLEDIDIAKYLNDGNIAWCIIGCESGPKRRECKIEWVESIVEQCKTAFVPVFVKQLNINGKVEHNITKFPKELQAREYPI